MWCPKCGSNRYPDLAPEVVEVMEATFPPGLKLEHLDCGAHRGTQRYGYPEAYEVTYFDPEATLGAYEVGAEWGKGWVWPLSQMHAEATLEWFMGDERRRP